MSSLLPKLNASDLQDMKFSSNQKYFYDYLVAISQGQRAFLGNEALQLRSPGPINHSRWLTHANCVMRYYIFHPDPPEALRRLMKYIIEAYAPAWFFIKRHPDFTKSDLYDTDELLSKDGLEFVPMSGFLPELTASDLKDTKFSSDQKFYIVAINQGQQAFLGNEALQLRSPGTINHSIKLVQCDQIWQCL